MSVELPFLAPLSLSSAIPVEGHPPADREVDVLVEW
jgi:hypothetical protein